MISKRELVIWLLILLALASVAVVSLLYAEESVKAGGYDLLATDPDATPQRLAVRDCTDLGYTEDSEEWAWCLDGSVIYWTEFLQEAEHVVDTETDGPDQAGEEDATEPAE